MDLATQCKVKTYTYSLKIQLMAGSIMSYMSICGAF